METFTEDLEAQNWAVSGDVSFQKRVKIPRISSYLDSNTESIELIDYKIEYDLDADALVRFLSEDLPGDLDTTGKDVFIKDIVSLATLFFNKCESKRVKLKLEPVSDDMCRIFHVDNIKQRLICTYKGLGTEWLEESNVSREGLGCGDNCKIVKDSSLIRRADEFEVLLLRGKKVSALTKGAVHRSPPVGTLSQTRILLKIDEL